MQLGGEEKGFKKRMGEAGKSGNEINQKIFSGENEEENFYFAFLYFSFNGKITRARK